MSILDEVEATGCTHVKIAAADIDGILRGKYIHLDKFRSIVESGFGFCSVVLGWDCNDVCYDNGKIAGWHNGYPDIQAKVDVATFREIPWDNGTPFFLADFDSDACPRQLLKNVIKKAEKSGYSASFGLEFEWFNFHETAESIRDKHFADPTPMTPGMFGYSILRANENQEFFHALMQELQEFDIPVEGLHTETGPGVLEVAILYSDALLAADRGILFKTAVKEIAHRFGIMPSFMARWSNQLPGCGGHLHQSLWDSAKKKNVFYDEKAPHKMSALFKHYLAGQLALLPEILPFFAPNVNSYKRLVEGFWAPTRSTWGIDNRTTALRVIPGSAKSTRVETRVPGSDINPYLAVAASLGAGLYGIEHKLELPEPVVGSAYASSEGKRFPRNLGEATEALANSKAAREIFGTEFVEHFVRTRDWEWRQFGQRVTTYERERYFEII